MTALHLLASAERKLVEAQADESGAQHALPCVVCHAAASLPVDGWLPCQRWQRQGSAQAVAAPSAGPVCAVGPLPCAMPASSQCSSAPAHYPSRCLSLSAARAPPAAVGPAPQRRGDRHGQRPRLAPRPQARQLALLRSALQCCCGNRRCVPGYCLPSAPSLTYLINTPSRLLLYPTCSAGMVAYLGSKLGRVAKLLAGAKLVRLLMRACLCL